MRDKETEVNKEKEREATGGSPRSEESTVGRENARGGSHSFIPFPTNKLIKLKKNKNKKSSSWQKCC